MNATERVALREGVELYDEMTAAVDERTLAILDRRRRTATVQGRGWLVHRMLLLADLVGLVAAFLLVELLSAFKSGLSTAWTGARVPDLRSVASWMDRGDEALRALRP